MEVRSNGRTLSQNFPEYALGQSHLKPPRIFVQFPKF